MTATNKGNYLQARRELEGKLGDRVVKSFPLRNDLYYACPDPPTEIVVYIGTRTDGKNLYASHSGIMYILDENNDKIPCFVPLPVTSELELILGIEPFPWIRSLADRQLRIMTPIKGYFLQLVQYYILLYPEILDRNNMESTVPDAQALTDAQKLIEKLDNYPRFVEDRGNPSEAERGVHIQSEVAQSFQGLDMGDISVAGVDDTASECGTDTESMLEAEISPPVPTAEAPIEGARARLGVQGIVRRPALSGFTSGGADRLSELQDQIGIHLYSRLPTDVKFINYCLPDLNRHINLAVMVGKVKPGYGRNGASAWAMVHTDRTTTRSPRMTIRVWVPPWPGRGHGEWGWEHENDKGWKNTASLIDKEPAFSSVSTYGQLRAVVRYHLLRGERYIVGSSGNRSYFNFPLLPTFVDDLKRACKRYEEPLRNNGRNRARALGPHQLAEEQSREWSEEHGLHPFIILERGQLPD